MSPDLEWQVRDEDGQQTITRTRVAAPSRWRRGLIVLSVILGAGLGALYMTIPQPPKPPEPTPTPAALPPPPLDPIVDREAKSLASGDRAAFMTLQDPIDSEWYQAQNQAFKTWGEPPGGDRLYTLLSMGTLPNGRQWVEVLQWRTNEVYVRETRFYRLRSLAGKLDWKRARPDPSFWSGNTWQGRSAHFDLRYPAEDNQIAWRVTQRFERVYQVLCRDLNCPQRPTRFMSMALIFRPDIDQPSLVNGAGLTLTLPSPRVAGYHEPLGVRDDAFTSLAFNSLLPIVTRIAAGDATPWQADPNGEWFVQGVMAWEALRIDLARDAPPEQTFINAPGELWPDLSQGEATATRQFYRDLLRDARLVPLPELWHWPIDAGIPNDRFDVMDGEIDALIAFIEEVHQPIGVVKFLNAIGKVKSLPEAIETALGVKYDELESQWLKWIGRRE